MRSEENKNKKIESNLELFQEFEEIKGFPNGIDFEILENTPTSIFNFDELEVIPSLETTTKESSIPNLNFVKPNFETKVNKIEEIFSDHLLKLKKVKELREIVDELKLKYKVPFHWTWKQNKDDLIDLLLDLNNNKYILKNPSFNPRRNRNKRKANEN